MLDGFAKNLIQPMLNRLALVLGKRGVSADTITLTGLALGVAAGAMIAYGYMIAAILLIIVSRLADGLDGAVAQLNGPTDRGAYLDIVLDFAFYGLIPLSFVIHNPEQNGLAGAIVLFAFYVNGASFLAFAAIAEKRKFSTTKRGAKSFFFSIGLTEATETIAIFIVWCLLPSYFPALAIMFAVMVLYTATMRIIEAWTQFNP